MHKKELLKLIKVRFEKQVSEVQKKRIFLKMRVIFVFQKSVLAPHEVTFFPDTTKRCANESYSCGFFSIEEQVSEVKKWKPNV